MRRLIIAIASTVTATVLLFSWPTSTNRGTTAVGPGLGSTGTGSSGSASSGTTSTGTKTYDGATASTRWGDVQVRITVTNGAITASEAITFPNGNSRDQQINAQAIPILNQEVVAKQSASISMVSGATVTSGGYIQSLQDALDQAGL
jgi:uncharacterized protein with FMN-binding domain